MPGQFNRTNTVFAFTVEPRTPCNTASHPAHGFLRPERLCRLWRLLRHLPACCTRHFGIESPQRAFVVNRHPELTNLDVDLAPNVDHPIPGDEPARSWTWDQFTWSILDADARSAFGAG